MRSLVVVALLAGFVSANTIFGDFVLTEEFGYSKKAVYDAVTLADDHVMFFTNNPKNTPVTMFDNVFQCTKSSCGAVYDLNSHTNFSLGEDASTSFECITSGKDASGAWHIFVSGQTSEAIQVTVGQEIVSIGKYSYFIFKLDMNLVIEQVVVLSPLLKIDALRLVNNKLAVVISAYSSASALEIKINNDQPRTVDSSLLTDEMNLLCLTNLDADVFTIVKVGGVNAQDIFPEAIDVIQLKDGSALLAASYLLPSGVSLFCKSSTYQGDHYTHSFVVIASIKANGEISAEGVTDAEVPDAADVSVMFLDENTLAVAHNLGDTAWDCPKLTTSLATYSVKTGNRLGLRCMNSQISTLLSVFMGRVDDNWFLLSSSFSQHLLIDNAAIWRTKKSLSVSDLEAPYALLFDKNLFVGSGIGFFGTEEPSSAYHPVGFFGSDGRVGILFSRLDSISYAYRYASIEMKTCKNGVFNATGFCNCFVGGTQGESACPENAPGSSSSSNPHPPQPHSSSSPSSPVVGPTDSTDNAGGFLGSQASIITFGCTAAAFGILAIIFIILFSKKRCGGSSGSEGTPMENLGE